MNEQIKEAIAKAIYCHKGHLPAPWDCAGDAGESDWKQLRAEAESQATAVMALVGPKKLVWEDDGNGCLRSGPYEVWSFDSGITMTHFRVVQGYHYLTPEAAQAAAQSHAAAAWWANTPLGKLVGVV